MKCLNHWCTAYIWVFSSIFFLSLDYCFGVSDHETDSTGSCLLVREGIFPRTLEVAAHKCSIEQLFWKVTGKHLQWIAVQENTCDDVLFKAVLALGS